MKEKEHKARDHEPKEEVFTAREALFLAGASLVFGTLIRVLGQLIS